MSVSHKYLASKPSLCARYHCIVRLIDSESVQRDCKFNKLLDYVFIPVGMYVNDNDIAIVFDSGCSVAVAPHLEDFIGPITKVDKTMRGLGASVKVEGGGIIQWCFRDDYGVKQMIEVKVYYIPKVRDANKALKCSNIITKDNTKHSF